MGDCDRGAHPKRLCCEATFSEEITLVQNAYGGFLPVTRRNCEFYRSRLDIKDRIGRVALSKDCLLPRKVRDCPATVDSRKKGLEVELAAFLGRCHGCQDRPPFNAKGTPEPSVYEPIMLFEVRYVNRGICSETETD